MEIDEAASAVDLPMERPLFSPPVQLRITDPVPEEGDECFAADPLYTQAYVDRAALAAHVRRALQTRQAVSLEELVATRPLEQGLAELLGYLSLAAEDPAAHVDELQTQAVLWTDRAGVPRRACLPLVVFRR
jgi:hypothetical protein